MRNFRKIILISVSLLLVLTVICIGIMEILMHSEYYHCCDIKNIDGQNGTIEVLLNGSSNGMNGINTSIMDSTLDVNCYNLCGPAMNSCSELTMIRQTHKDNPHLKTVFLTIAYDDMALSPGAYTGNIYAMPRIKGFKNRVNYFFKYVDFNDWDVLCGNFIKDGLYVATSNIIGKNSVLGTDPKSNVDYEAKGYRRLGTADLSISNDEIINSYNIAGIDRNDDNYSINDGYYREYFKYCKDNDIRCIVVVTPLADYWLWRIFDMDDYEDYLKNLTSDFEIELYDINLLKDRYSLFSDKTSYSDKAHLSGEGSDTLTTTICDLYLKSSNGENLDYLFYDSYEEMKQNSPYMPYYIENAVK